MPPGREITALREACRRLRICASPNVYLKQGAERCDASLLINARGEVLGVSKMVHIAQAKYFYEQDYYTPSDDGFKVYDTSTISSPTWRRASPPSGDKLPHSQRYVQKGIAAMMNLCPMAYCQKNRINDTALPA